jgi:hypothetical protein
MLLCQELKKEKKKNRGHKTNLWDTSESTATLDEGLGILAVQVPAIWNNERDLHYSILHIIALLYTLTEQ